MGFIELMFVGMSTKLFWFIMYLLSMMVNWFIIGILTEADGDDWNDGDLFVPMLLCTFFSPIAIIISCMIICYKNGRKHFEIKNQRAKLRAERQGALSDEQLERLGVSE